MTDVAGPAGLDGRLSRAFHKSGVAGAIAGLSGQGGRERAAAGVRDTRTGEPMRDSTPVRIASVTKPIVAAATVLAARTVPGLPGLLDRPVVEYLPELRSSWRVSPELTVRLLLSQSSGLFAEEGTEALLALGDGDDALLGAARMVVAGSQVEPIGTSWAYYNGSFWLAGAVLARVCGQSFEEVVTELVLKPARMSSTGFSTPDGGASGHHEEQEPVVQHYPRARRPGGGLWSTADDLLSFAEFLLDDADLLATMSAPVIDTDRPARYGLGCYATGEVVYHPGGWGGFGSLLVLVPRRRLALAMVVNESGARGEAAIDAVTTEVLNDVGVAPIRQE